MSVMKEFQKVEIRCYCMIVCIWEVTIWYTTGWKT